MNAVSAGVIILAVQIVMVFQMVMQLILVVDVEILDHQFRPVAGYSGDTAVPVTEPGLRQHVFWYGKESLQNIKGPIRIKVSWLGTRQLEALLHAVYLTSG